MAEVISVKFKSCGKNYYFDPAGVVFNKGEQVIVETSKGLELTECTYGNHTVDDTVVIQPLRPVVRKATDYDLRSAEQNKAKEKEAFGICKDKIKEHGLDMKLVDVECSFDGSKTTFFFTSDGRVDFRELVKDLAGIFHNRIELRQIGVRDEAKMIGGVGICGRPYCCHQFLEEFAPVSTKMAKVQSLSLNPAKISGSCGRLMCCLRYEEDAYEDLLTKVPKQGAYVETVDGYGVATQVNLLRQTVKVSLDNESDEAVHLYAASEVATVPGGRPKDGEEAPHVLQEREKADEEELIEDINQNDSFSGSEWALTGYENAAVQVDDKKEKPQPVLYHDNQKNQDKKSITETETVQTEKDPVQNKSDSGNEPNNEISNKKSRSGRKYHGKKNNRADIPADKRQEGKTQETNAGLRKTEDHAKSEKKDKRTKSEGNNGKNTRENTKDTSGSSGNSGNGHRKGNSNPKNSQPKPASEKQTANHASAAENTAGTEKKQPRKNNNYYRKKYYRKPKTNSNTKTEDHDKT